MFTSPLYLAALLSSLVASTVTLEKWGISDEVLELSLNQASELRGGIQLTKVNGQSSLSTKHGSLKEESGMLN
ncbi:hypothetical protein TSUD_174090 [Trifolium subterraneum]|nr:hypothetical protein TSUD_174090 [Trifolium subterraneum]